MEVTFTPEEHELVTEILQEHYRELLRELSRVEHRKFKIVLRNREQLLDAVLKKLTRRNSAVA